MDGEPSVVNYRVFYLYVYVDDVMIDLRKIILTHKSDYNVFNKNSDEDKRIVVI